MMEAIQLCVNGELRSVNVDNRIRDMDLTGERNIAATRNVGWSALNIDRVRGEVTAQVRQNASLLEQIRESAGANTSESHH
jgi:hypothetical protein